MSNYRRNHYVPQWYQRRFIPKGTNDNNLYYINLKPEIVNSNGHIYTKKSLIRKGPTNCFVRDDLYTTNLKGWASTEIEQEFFGRIDLNGKKAVEYFSAFEHPDANKEALLNLLSYMSVQKLRTPKGLAYLANLVKLNDKNAVLNEMQRLERLFCALWVECIWSIADASESQTKFIISDHPVTMYNIKCFPHSNWCKEYKDPDVWLSGTHTLFPLSLDKILILTNLSWLRNPYGNPLKHRPNPNPFRSALFNFTQIQTGRMLSELEVNEINFILKRRAYKHIAAANEEWLYPEERITTEYWDKLGDGYLLMPDPRSVKFSAGIIIGFDNDASIVHDEYGRQPYQEHYNNKRGRAYEIDSFRAYTCQFARVFGRKRRGTSFDFGPLVTEDSENYHDNLLKYESLYKSSMKNKKNK